MPSLPLPEAFRRQSEALLGLQEASQLFAALETEAPVSIRLNPRKGSGLFDGAEPIPWCTDGRYLLNRPSFTLDPAFHAGAYYVQEASSQFVDHIFRSLFEGERSLRVLDLCAAPGGKTTLLASRVGPDGLVVANEVIRSRALILADNVAKWGLANVAVTSNDPAHFAGYEHFFDLIVVDAPCSGEGMFRKTPEAREPWSPEIVRLCAARDRRILSDIWGCLRPGGVLLFSTCTFNPNENEGTVRWLVDEYGAEGAEMTCDPAWGIVQGETLGIPTFRFYPHRLRGEGFFAAVLRKSDGRYRERAPKPRKSIFAEPAKAEIAELARWVRHPEAMRFVRVGNAMYAYHRESFVSTRIVVEGLSAISSGMLLGNLYGGWLRPEHSLALFCELSPEAAPVGELPLEAARDYLRKREVDPDYFTEGINRVTHQGLGLGWIKRIGGRCNNLYPKELRILNL